MICVYPADCTDFSTNGNGTLAPLTAEVTETLNGEYELTLVHSMLVKHRNKLEAAHAAMEEAQTRMTAAISSLMTLAKRFTAKHILDGRLRVIKVCGGLADSVGAVLHGLLQGFDLALQLIDLFGRFSVLLLIPLHILPGGNGGRVGFSQGIPVVFIGDGGGFDLKAQIFLTGLGLLQPPGVILMAVVVFLQLIVCCHQRPAVLLHGPLLLGELVPEHGQLGFRARDGLFVILNASPGQTEGGLGFLDLLIDGAHIAREIAGDSATTSSRRVSAIKVHLLLFANIGFQ